ncbi:hypothetical protein GCM10023192_80690 [Amycolatopsis samaneae]
MVTPGLCEATMSPRCHKFRTPQPGRALDVIKVWPIRATAPPMSFPGRPEILALCAWHEPIWDMSCQTLAEAAREAIPARAATE